MKTPAFSQSSCWECPSLQQARSSYESSYCTGFPGKKQKRFSKAGPKRKIPDWCPKRISPPACRIYGFINDEEAIMEFMLNHGSSTFEQGIAFPSERRYKLRGSYQCLGGTSAEKLAKQGRPRSDGKSLSRTAQLVPGRSSDFLFAASSGPGEANDKGLIVPRFGKNPENHVAVSMTFETLSELLLLTKTHYEAWLAAWYYQQNPHRDRSISTKPTQTDYQTTEENGATAMF